MPEVSCPLAAARRIQAVIPFFLVLLFLIIFCPATGHGATPIWEPTGSMGTARTGHTATLLPNGKVLVAGDASAELYDPAAGTWTPTGSMATARSRHTATLLPNGKVLVAGGTNTGNNYEVLESAELYDPATGTWTPTGSLATARQQHTATLLPNGKVLVAGGYMVWDSEMATAELYDPTTGLWSATGSLTYQRQYHTANLLPNGKVLVAAGIFNGVPDTALKSAELYDPATGSWTLTGSLATVRCYYTANLLPNGKVLVAGGFNAAVVALASAELYDPATGTWTPTGSMGTARSRHTATLLPNGKVLVAGGYDIQRLASVELYGLEQTINLSLTSLTPSCPVGASPASQTFQVWNTDATSFPLNYTITKDVNWLTVSPTSGTSTGEQDTITVTYNTATLTPGTYTGHITVTDPYASNSPQTVNVTLQVLGTPAVISLSPTALSSFCAVGTNGPNQTFEVWNAGDGTMSYTISTNDSWLSVSPASGASSGEHDTITVIYASAGLALGTYHGNITITAPPAVTNSPQTIPVTMTVTQPSSIALTPTFLFTSCSQGQNAASQNFEVWNAGGGPMTYSITTTQSWLSVTPNFGTSSGEHQSVTVNYATAGLSPGTYTGYITVTAPGAGNSPQQVTVVVQVNASAATIAVKPVSLRNSSPKGKNAPSQSFEVWNSGGGTLSFNISQDQPWLSCTPDAGTSTGDHKQITVNYANASLPLGTYTGTITISASGASNSPVQIPVKLQVNTALPFLLLLLD